VVVDGAQAVAHLPVDVQAWDCDFCAFSSHKVFGPSGAGVLYGKRALLERIDPPAGGGGSMREVSFESIRYADLPARLEPGTPAIGAAIALHEALRFVTELGRDDIARWEHALLLHATERLEAVPGVRVLGRVRDKAPIVSFTVEGVHAHDLGTLLDQRGIAVRAGDHCAQPVLRRFGLDATARASFAFYNTLDEVEALVEGVRHAKSVFG
jgi:cysteine desulfurase / selenocysteine lyase